MSGVRGDLFIRRPVEEVFDTVADERNTYDPRQRSVELVTEGPIGVGSRFRNEIKAMGRPVTMEVEITAYERPHLLGTVTHSAGMDIHSRLSFEPADGATHMSWSSALQPRGALRLLTPVLGIIARYQMARIWHGLKATLEEERERS